ncbi:MAG: hypothetical protein JWO92_1819 [Chitinophagaceae bacterium]|nr:hypothetical protein [Chitinophagaceae bacterium]
MKKSILRNTYVILIIVIIISQGCRLKSGGTGIIGNDNKSSDSWSKEYRSKFIQDCIDKASEKLSASKAFSYCNCITEKVEMKYPDENNVKVSNEEIAGIKSACLVSGSAANNQSDQSNNSNLQGWSLSDRQEFMDNCPSTAIKTLGTIGANDYCDCMLKKLMQEYPDSKDVGNVSKTHISALAFDCLRR